MACGLWNFQLTLAALALSKVSSMVSVLAAWFQTGVQDSILGLELAQQELKEADDADV